MVTRQARSTVRYTAKEKTSRSEVNATTVSSTDQIITKKNEFKTLGDQDECTKQKYATQDKTKDQHKKRAKSINTYNRSGKKE